MLAPLWAIPSFFALLIAYIVLKYVSSGMEFRSYLFHLIGRLNEDARPRLNDADDIAAFREKIKNSIDMFSNIITNQRIINLNADVGIILYYPLSVDASAPNQRRPVMIWIHGGGFVSGSAHGDRIITQNFADGCDCIVASIDYRLAPEHPFPAAPQDTILAVEWIHDNIASYGGDPTKIVIGGESAGGNLAAATVLGLIQSSRDTLLPAVRGLVLAAPCLDHGSYTTSHFKYATTGLLSLTQMLWYWRLYLGDNDQGGICASNSLACPLRLRPEEAAKFPPTKIVLAQQDILFDEGVLFGEKLKASGVMVDTVVYPGAIHGHFGKSFFGNSGTSSLQDAIGFFKDVTK
jgi:acetyl esterase